MGSSTLTPTGSTPSFTARLYTRFNGTTWNSYGPSGNVSSFTSIATGRSQINFTTAMPDTYYACVANGSASTPIARFAGAYDFLTTSVKIITENSDGGDANREFVNVIIVR